MAEHDESEGSGDFGFIAMCVAVLVLAILFANRRADIKIKNAPLVATTTPEEIRTTPRSQSVPTNTPLGAPAAETNIEEVENRIREIEAEIEMLESEREHSLNNTIEN